MIDEGKRVEPGQGWGWASSGDRWHDGCARLSVPCLGTCHVPEACRRPLIPQRVSCGVPQAIPICAWPSNDILNIGEGRRVGEAGDDGGILG